MILFALIGVAALYFAFKDDKAETVSRRRRYWD